MPCGNRSLASSGRGKTWNCPVSRRLQRHLSVPYRRPVPSVPPQPPSPIQSAAAAPRSTAPCSRTAAASDGSPPPGASSNGGHWAEHIACRRLLDAGIGTCTAFPEPAERPISPRGCGPPPAAGRELLDSNILRLAPSGAPSTAPEARYPLPKCPGGHGQGAA